jgi:hypothetical protein
MKKEKSKKYVVKLNSDHLAELPEKTQEEYAQKLCKEFAGALGVSTNDVLVVVLRNNDSMSIEEFR